MKDENIKEILDKLQKVANCETASRNALMKMPYTDYQLLLDYITNLQEENERLKELNVCVGCNNNPDYKSRIDKALVFIDKYCIDDEFYINLSYKEKAIIEVKKILQGEDKE